MTLKKVIPLQQNTAIIMLISLAGPPPARVAQPVRAAQPGTSPLKTPVGINPLPVTSIENSHQN